MSLLILMGYYTRKNAVWENTASARLRVVMGVELVYTEIK
jgi:hypothetical protein